MFANVCKFASKCAQICACFLKKCLSHCSSISRFKVSHLFPQPWHPNITTLASDWWTATIGVLGCEGCSKNMWYLKSGNSNTKEQSIFDKN